MSGDNSDRTAALLLDLDGTLIDSVVLHTLAWRRALYSSDLDIAMSRIQPLVGMGGPELLSELIGEDNDELKDRHDKEFEQLRGDARPLPGASELLQRAKAAGVRTYIVTSSKPDDAEYLLGLIEGASVDGIVHSEDVARTKPHPDLFEAAIDRWDLDREQTIAVGDSEWDVRSAARAGLRSIGVLTGGTPAERLLGVGAEAVYRSCLQLAGSLLLTH